MRGPSTIGVNLRVTGHCNQGGRKYMEDVFCVAYQQTEDDKDLEYAFFGIFDGHGGGEAAAYAKEHLMDNIVNQKHFWSDDDNLVLKAIKEGFINTHQGMWNALPTWPKTASGLPSTSGTTASIAFIRKSKIYVGHVGDSGIVLGLQEEGAPPEARWTARQLTVDHKPTTPAEKERIEQSGGKVKYKSGVLRVVWNRPRLGHKGPVRRSTRIDEIPFLAVARSLGDLWSYNSEKDEFVVSPEPDVYVIPIDVTKHRVLVFGTDGLWNMVTPWAAIHSAQQTEVHNEAQIIAKATNPNGPHMQWMNPSKRLVDYALERWYDMNLRADNVSCVTVMLDPPGPPKSEVILRQCQLKRKKYRQPDRMSVHSNVYDAKDATVPVRVPLFRPSAPAAEGEGGSSGSGGSPTANAEGNVEPAPAVRRNHDRVAKTVVGRSTRSETSNRQTPNTRRSEAGGIPKDEVQSPEVSSSIDDSSLDKSDPSKPKPAPPSASSHGPPKGRIHRVSGSLFVQNNDQNPVPRPMPNATGAAVPRPDRRFMVTGPGASQPAPLSGSTVFGSTFARSVLQRAPGQGASSPAPPGGAQQPSVPGPGGAQTAPGSENRPPAPGPRAAAPLPPSSASQQPLSATNASSGSSSTNGTSSDNIGNLSRIVDRMCQPAPATRKPEVVERRQQPAAAPAPALSSSPPTAAAPSAQQVASKAPKPVESRVLRSSHHTGLPAAASSVGPKESRKSKKAPAPSPSTPTPAVSTTAAATTPSPPPRTRASRSAAPSSAPRQLRSESKSRVIVTRSATKRMEPQPALPAKRKRASSPPRSAGKTPAKRRRSARK